MTNKKLSLWLIQWSSCYKTWCKTFHRFISTFSSESIDVMQLHWYSILVRSEVYNARSVLFVYLYTLRVDAWFYWKIESILCNQYKCCHILGSNASSVFSQIFVCKVRIKRNEINVRVIAENKGRRVILLQARLGDVSFLHNTLEQHIARRQYYKRCVCCRTIP